MAAAQAHAPVEVSVGTCAEGVHHGHVSVHVEVLVKRAALHVRPRARVNAAVRTIAAAQAEGAVGLGEEVGWLPVKWLLRVLGTTVVWG